MKVRNSLTVAALLVLSASPSYAESDAEVCAVLAERMRPLVMDALALQNAAVAALPTGWEQAEPTPSVEGEVRDLAASSLPASVAGPLGDWMLETIRLRGPMTEYNQKSAQALVALEACAGTK